MSYIKIEITGEARSGKSTVANMILQTLSDAGLNARLTDGPHDESKTRVSNFDCEKFSKSLAHIVDKTSVDIITTNPRKTVMGKGDIYLNASGEELTITSIEGDRVFYDIEDGMGDGECRLDVWQEEMKRKV